MFSSNDDSAVITLNFPSIVNITSSMRRILSNHFSACEPGFPLDKAVSYAKLRNPLLINDLNMQYYIQDRYCNTPELRVFPVFVGIMHAKQSEAC